MTTVDDQVQMLMEGVCKWKGPLMTSVHLGHVSIKGMCPCIRGVYLGKVSWIWGVGQKKAGGQI